MYYFIVNGDHIVLLIFRYFICSSLMFINSLIHHVTVQLYRKCSYFSIFRK